MSKIKEFPAALRKALFDNKSVQFELANATILDTFSMSGSKTATSGTKMQLSVVLPDKSLADLTCVVPLAGNAAQIVNGLSLTDKQQAVIDAFWSTELYCAVAERKAALCTLLLNPVDDSNKCGFTLLVNTPKGAKGVVHGFISARDTVCLARDLALGVGYQFDPTEVQSIVDLLAEIAFAEKATEVKKAA
jgi:hypothetical protein